MFRVLAPAAAIAAAAAPALADGIVPRDGTWITEARDGAFSDACPAALLPFLRPMLGAMESQSGQTQEMTFAGDFDPAAMATDADAEGIEWVQEDTDRWVGQLPGDDGASIGSVTLEVLAPDRIDGAMVLRIGDLMGDDVAALGVSAAEAEGCTMTMEMTSTHAG